MMRLFPGERTEWWSDGLSHRAWPFLHVKGPRGSALHMTHVKSRCGLFGVLLDEGVVCTLWKTNDDATFITFIMDGKKWRTKYVLAYRVRADR